VLRNKLKSLTILLLLVFILKLSSCVEYTAKFYLNLDGSGVLNVVYLVNKSLLATVVKQRMMTHQFPLTPEGIKKYYERKKGVKLLKIDFKDVSKDTERVHIIVAFDNIKYLNDEQTEYSWDLEGGRYVLRIKIKGYGHASRNNPIIEKAIKEAMGKYYITYEVHMPRKVVETNADEIDWNTVTWKISLYDMTHLSRTKVLYAEVPAKWYEVLWWMLKKLWRKIVSIFS